MTQPRCRTVVALIVALSLQAAFADGPARAEHDTISSPPPTSTTAPLAPSPWKARPGITVSGISSGGFFAHQFHIAFSSLVNGAAIIAGGPYGCVETISNPFSPLWRVPLDRVSAATVACTHYYGSRFFGLTPPQPKAEDSIRLVREAWAQGVIDNPANLADHRVWLFHGEQDKVVPDAAFDALLQLYSGLGVREPNLGLATATQRRAANHGMPIAAFSGTSQFPIRQCREHAPPFVIECGFDAADLLLRHLHPQGFNEPTDDQHRDGTLIAFDQTEFFNPGDEKASLHRVGYVYLPKRCASESCRVHIAFHGCRQNLDSVHDDFIRDAGYNAAAATNGIIILYPQAARSAVNPNGCWDFWGFTGASYLSKDGPQMRAVKGMADRLLGER